MAMTMTAETPVENLTLTQVDDRTLALAKDASAWLPLCLRDTLKRLHDLEEQRRALKKNRATSRGE
ncbi:MAG: hypothetical protein ACYC9Q_15010 [Bacillota bacterium]